MENELIEGEILPAPITIARETCHGTPITTIEGEAPTYVGIDREGRLTRCKANVVAVSGEVITPMYGSVTINITGLPKFAESLEKAKESIRWRPLVRPVIKMIDGDLSDGAIDA